MHTYRDALPAVHTAMAVYPGTGGEATQYRATGDESPGGVGAIPLAPGIDHDTSAPDRALHAALTIGGA